MTNIPVLITTEWLASHLKDSNLRLLDVTPFLKQKKDNGIVTITGKEAYNNGHIPNAVYVNIENELSNLNAELPLTIPSREKFIEKITDLGIGEGTYVVIYQHDSFPASYWASRLWWQLTL